jgi:hypothetical protein
VADERSSQLPSGRQDGEPIEPGIQGLKRENPPLTTTQKEEVVAYIDRSEGQLPENTFTEWDDEILGSFNPLGGLSGLRSAGSNDALVNPLVQVQQLERERPIGSSRVEERGGEALQDEGIANQSE